MEITARSFDALTPVAVHEILRLRAEVFVVEQDCPYVDPDDGDLVSEHVMGRSPAAEGGRLIAYARIQPTPEGPKIGRVITSADVRGTGLGHAIMDACLERVGDVTTFLHAQNHLRAFYAEHGYEPEGDVFDEDGIPHIKMVRSAQT